MEPVVQRGGAATKLGDNLNDEMVSLSAVTTSDVTWLAEALARHHAETGSALPRVCSTSGGRQPRAVSAALHRASPLAGLSPSGTTTRVSRHSRIRNQNHSKWNSPDQKTQNLPGFRMR